MGGVVGPGGDNAEIPGVEQLAAHHAGQPGFALAFAVGAAQGAKPRLRRVAAIDRPKNVISFVETHNVNSFVPILRGSARD
jgi:hypothetical protein